MLFSSPEANLDSMERDLKIIQKDNTAKNELLRAQQNYANDTRKKEFESQLRSVKDNERSTQQIIMNYEREMDVLKKSSDNDIKRLELELKKANERLLEVGHESEIYRITSRHERILRDKEEEVKKAHMKILDVQKEYAARLESMTAAIRSEVDEVKSAYSQMAKESEGGSAAIVSRLYTNFQEVLRKQQKMLNEARNRERLMLEALRSGQFNTFYNEQEEYEDGGPGVKKEYVGNPPPHHPWGKFSDIHQTTPGEIQVIQMTKTDGVGRTRVLPTFMPRPPERVSNLLETFRSAESSEVGRVMTRGGFDVSLPMLEASSGGISILRSPGHRKQTFVVCTNAARKTQHFELTPAAEAYLTPGSTDLPLLYLVGRHGRSYSYHPDPPAPHTLTQWIQGSPLAARPALIPRGYILWPSAWNCRRPPVPVPMPPHLSSLARYAGYANALGVYHATATIPCDPE
ncbi:hypothetical protein AAG570_000278 [Ranatra chinensis]|uniref:Uncharacterized protein n=1 Tax=Ranatra chinensis TaxID=642074 RepID=A0ABD0YX97_9HEMI